jgi:hypothetical protein
MNDQLDKKIRAFVGELLDDPPANPPFPDTQVVNVPRPHDEVKHPVFRRLLTGPAVAVAVFVTALALGAVALVLRPAGTPDEIFTGKPTPTTHAASTETFLGVPIEPAIAFRARVRYEAVTGDDFPSSASVGVFYLGPGVFRVEIESVDLEPSPSASLLPGNYVVTDGTSAASFLAAKGVFLLFPAGEASTLDLGEFGWRHWADRCREADHEIVEETTILSRQALHVRCTEPLGDTEVWVDIETGLVLSARSAEGATDLLPTADELGKYAYAFEVTELEVGVPIGADLFEVSAPAGSEESQVERRVRRIVATNEDCDVDCAEAVLADLAEYPLVGSPAPPLTGVLLDGTSFDLATLRGERVAMLWWASWCPPSVDLLVAFDKHSKERTDVSFLGVLFQDDPVQAEGIVNRTGISLPAVDLGDNQFDQEWRIEGCPTTVLVAEDGTVAAAITGAWPAEGLAALFAQAGW